MATAWADIVAAAMVQIDDVRLQDQLSTSPAQFYRRMAAWIKQAMPLLNRPPQLLAYLKKDMVAPEYADAEWASTAESMTAETTLNTGAIGYDLFSVVQVIEQDQGVVTYAPYADAQYDPETGDVTFPVQSAEGISYVLDFYTDGTFQTLTDTQIRLFALAVAVVWDERFTRNYLNLQPKIHDSSFSTVNEATYTEKVSKRLHDNRIMFNDELRAYEQLCAYARAFQNAVGNMPLL